MLSKMFGSAKRKVGPVGLSLVAAALTATAFAAVSVAAKDDGGNGNGNARGGPPMFHEELSDEDRQALEDFRQCMEDNGAPAPPEPPKPGEEPQTRELPTPPSDADREKIEQALEACEDKLPEGAHAFGGPGGPGCGPPPGVEGAAVPAPPPAQGNQQSAPQSSGSGAAS